jgi:hypothetical protein
MSRIAPPSPYVSWNTFIEDQVAGITDPDERRLIKRNIKLELIASPERHAGNDTTDPRYREYNMYISPGTVSPTMNRPWTISSPYSEHNIVTEQDDTIDLITEAGETLVAE